MATAHHARIANTPDYRITVGADIITPTIRPRLVSLSITASRGGEADQLTPVLDDSDGAMAIQRATGVSISTIARVLQQAGLNRLSALEPATARPTLRAPCPRRSATSGREKAQSLCPPRASSGR